MLFLVGQKGELLMFKNYTPHAINILDNDNNIIKTIPSEGNIRVSTKSETFYKIPLGDYVIPINKTNFGELEYPGNYDIENSNFIIVSRIVKNHPDKINDDRFIVPDGIVRDSQGNIIGCKSFSL